MSATLPTPTSESLACPARDVQTGVREYTQIIHYGGRHFSATNTMADIFMARAGDIIDRDGTELVPLLHKQGVELLLVTPTSRITISQVDIGTPQPQHPARPAGADFGEGLAS